MIAAPLVAPLNQQLEKYFHGPTLEEKSETDKYLGFEPKNAVVKVLKWNLKYQLFGTITSESMGIFSRYFLKKLNCNHEDWVEVESDPFTHCLIDSDRTGF